MHTLQVGDRHAADSFEGISLVDMSLDDTLLADIVAEVRELKLHLITFGYYISVEYT